MFTLASWNVNSIKVRLPQVLNWLNQFNVDALVLQETKCLDEDFPQKAFEEAGFDAFFVGQKTYNGVALIVRKNVFKDISNIALNIPYFPDEQKRVIAATLHPKEGDPVHFIGAYVPNGQTPGAAKYLYKLDWLSALEKYLSRLQSSQTRIVLGGDFNIAPDDLDVWNPKGWEGRILVSYPERQAFQSLLQLGFVDSFRRVHQTSQSFSWWDYRSQGFLKNQGLRIDHLLVSSILSPNIVDAGIDSTPRGWEQPSDHAPIWVKIDL